MSLLFHFALFKLHRPDKPLTYVAAMCMLCLVAVIGSLCSVVQCCFA